MRTTRSYLLRSTLSNLIVFESVGRLKSFTAAADELNMTQSAVSHAIRKLESVLERRLFVRNGANIKETFEGAELMRSASDCIDVLDTSLNKISAPAYQAGALVIAMTNSFARHWFLPRILEAVEAAPGLKLCIQSVDRETVNLDQENIDAHIALCAQAPTSYEAIPLWDEIIYAVCSRSFLDQNGQCSRLEDLGKSTLIHFENRVKPSMSWNDWFRLQGVAIDIVPNNLRYADYSLAFDAALRGDGILMGWAPIINGLLDEGLLCLAYPKPVQGPYKYYLLVRRGIFASEPNRTFRRWLQEAASQPSKL